jgi:hypothetical protein
MALLNFPQLHLALLCLPQLCLALLNFATICLAAPSFCWLCVGLLTFVLPCSTLRALFALLGFACLLGLAELCFAGQRTWAEPGWGHAFLFPRILAYTTRRLQMRNINGHEEQNINNYNTWVPVLLAENECRKDRCTEADQTISLQQWTRSEKLRGSQAGMILRG